MKMPIFESRKRTPLQSLMLDPLAAGGLESFVRSNGQGGFAEAEMTPNRGISKLTKLNKSSSLIND